MIPNFRQFALSAKISWLSSMLLVALSYANDRYASAHGHFANKGIDNITVVILGALAVPVIGFGIYIAFISLKKSS